MKRVIALLLSLCLLCGMASAQPLTGRTGFSCEYPAELLTVVEQYGHSTMLLASDTLEEGFNLQILATDPGAEQADPVAFLADWMDMLGCDASDIVTAENSKGAHVWSVRFMLENSVNWVWILQQDGREFQISAYMDGCEEKYLPAVQSVVDTFAVDLNGDLSGFEDDEEEESDFYTTMVNTYDPVLRLYGQACYEGWDMAKLEENDVSLLMVYMEDPAEIKIDFIDLGGNQDGSEYGMALFTVNAETGGADLLGLYAQNGSELRTVLTSGERDLFSLVKDQNGVYAVEEAASNSAFQSAILYHRVNANGEMMLIEGTVFDYEAAEGGPWFITHDTDWDVSNDKACTEDEASALQEGYTDVTDLDTGLTLADFMEIDMGLPVSAEE